MKVENSKSQNVIMLWKIMREKEGGREYERKRRREGKEIRNTCVEPRGRTG